LVFGRYGRVWKATALGNNKKGTYSFEHTDMARYFVDNGSRD
jgi:hypothetical protein